jgi:hypothetical protein
VGGAVTIVNSNQLRSNVKYSLTMDPAAAAKMMANMSPEVSDFLA